MTGSRLPGRALARLGFLAAAACAAAHAHAGTAPSASCEVTYERATAVGRAAVAADPAAVFTDYSGGEAAQLLAAINAAPPATAYLAEHVLVVETPGGERVRVALIHDGCLAHALEASPDGWRKLRSGAIGDPS
jgi:hypothetical protein